MSNAWQASWPIFWKPPNGSAVAPMTSINDIDKAAFMENPLVQDAAIRNLEIIGEASRNITRHHPQFAAAHPELPFTCA